MAEPEWVALQKKIFTRWCKMKLVRRPAVASRLNDIAADMSDSLVLIALTEELSESKFPDKVNWEKPETSRIKKVALMNNALKFVMSKGVDAVLKLKPLPEDLVDGKIDPVLSLVWGMMLRFIKIGDDDDEASSKLNAKDALLMWCKQKCQGYPQISVDSFKKTSKSSFHNGLAMCGIIAKHRPKMIPNMAELDGSDLIKTIQIAQDAAEVYFGLEKYVTPQEVTKLDEASMFVYVSEYYTGISNQRKIDLAGRRITKLIKYTKENDRLREEYNKTAADYKERLKNVEAVLNERHIDNTMAGAEAKLAEFYKYKTEDKNVLLGNQLQLESSFNNLAMRLVAGKRPEFVPPEGVTLKNVAEALAHLEQVEQERSVALHAELNRQIMLVRVAGQHKSIFENLKKWVSEKEDYLKQRPIIDSVSSAQLQLRLLEAFKKEKETVISTTFAKLKELRAFLEKEIYEHIDTVKQLEADVDNSMVHLDEMVAQRAPVLDDDLKRETYKQEVRLQHKEFMRMHELLDNQWIKPKEVYLNTYVEIHSVEEANVQLSLVDLHEKDCRLMGDSLVDTLKKLAKQIMDSKYESQWSTYTFEHTQTKDPVHEYSEPTHRQTVTDNEKYILEKWALLDELTAKLKGILADHLAREEYASKTRIIANNYMAKLKEIKHWVEASETYLAAREHVHNVQDARTELSRIQSFIEQLHYMHDTKVKELTAIKDELFARKYETQLSSYVFEHSKSTLPTFDVEVAEKKAEILSCEEWVAKRWESMHAAAEVKLGIMKDHHAREEYKVDTHVMASGHKDKYQDLLYFASNTQKYLKTREDIHSVHEAKTQISKIEILQKDLESMLNTQVKDLQKAGQEVIARKYQTDLSSYEYEHTIYKEPTFEEHRPELKAQLLKDEEEVLQVWAAMKEGAAEKLAIMKDHHSREEFRVESHVIANGHKNKFEELKSWVEQSETYLNFREHVHSIHEANTHTTQLQIFIKDLKEMQDTQVAKLFGIGKSLMAREYKTNLSSYVYDKTFYSAPEFNEHIPEHRELIVNNETWISQKWQEMGELAQRKMHVLEDHLKRENHAVIVRQQGQQHKEMFAKLKIWIDGKEDYLKQRPVIDSIADAQVQLLSLQQYNAEYKMMESTSIVGFFKLGKEISDSKYSSELSEYAYEHMIYKEPNFDEDRPEIRAALDEHTQFVSSHQQELSNLANKLKEDLDASLAQEIKKENLRLEYAHAALEFNNWSKETSEALAIESFGFTLEEVQEYKKTIDSTTEKITKDAAVRLAAVISVHTNMVDSGVKQNIYTQVTVPNLEQAKVDALAAVAKRNEAFEKELARQTENDKLCQEFAKVADSFAHHITSLKSEITGSKADLEGQLQFVVANIEECSKPTQLESVKAWADKITAAGITQIRHTTLTYKDVEVSAAQFIKFLQTKKMMLETEIQNAKLKGITPDQMREIEQNFKAFDKDNDDKIDRKDFTTCLFSLGEERTGKEITEILAQYGNGSNCIVYEKFKDFLIHLFGDADTKEELSMGLSLINRGMEAKHSMMEQVLPPDDVSYFESTAPKTEGGFNYNGWLDVMYSK
eukprot:TRINITY_DN18728_c0_g1_i1.p1 TRINITY_DN18728_c0_g1~~TRINITY_DN18728_c0_g1_i1.p1  ORF type:complete len:1570 (+),score=567.85 TRINITY_DN18728_c0_g1_i1:44-4753(+)